MRSERRKAQLLEFLTRRQQSSVVELCRRFDVSVATIRRDLTRLQNEGHIRRTHGGAVVEQRRLIDLSYRERERRCIQQKRHIAEKTVSLIEAGDRVFFNDGTTIMQIARKLAQKKIPLEVMTNSIKVADTLLFNRDIDVTLIGGSISEHSLACSGPLAELLIESLNADKAVICVDAFDPEWGVSIQSIAMGSLTRKMIAKSDRVIVVGDSSKLRASAAMTVCPWKDVDRFVTDAIDARERRRIEKEAVEIIT